MKDTAIEKPAKKQPPTTAIDRAMVEVLGPLAVDELNLLAQDAALADKRSDATDLSWLPEWFLERKNELAAARDMVKEQAKRILAQIDAREKAMDWKYAEQFMAQVQADLRAQGGKKKSFDYLTGRAGWRSTGGKPTLVVDDETAATAMAELMCPEAVTTKLKTSELLKFAQATGMLMDGTHVEDTEKVESFYPAPLLIERERQLLKGDSDVPESD